MNLKSTGIANPYYGEGITFRLLRTVFAILLSTSLTGCSLIDDLEDELNDDDPVHCEAGRTTDMYFSDAIHYNSSQQRWVFHNWKGSGDNGSCDIHINIHDGQITLSSTVRQAIQSGSAAWRNEIVAAGTPCDVFLHFESLGDAGVGSSPRIDLEFVELLQGGDIAGSTVVTTSVSSRTFSHVSVQLASDLVVDGDTLAIPESEYKTIITHEFGHAFGILGFNGATGHSTEPEDVMFATADCSALSSGDIATMREAYTRTPYYTPAVSGLPFGAAVITTSTLCMLRRGL